MLSIKWIQHVDYYLDQARPDYYFQGGEPEGVWWGRGAEDLRLKGTVHRRQLTHLFSGFSPDGRQPLIQNAGAKNHQAAWDLTFSAPKSVSVFWSQADDKTRHRLQQLHFEAVQEALEYLQEVAALTRRGKGGIRKELAHLVVAMFEHGSSRELDPHLHTHCVVLNVATRDDRTSGTILSEPFYRHKLTAGALYRAAFDAKLRSELGLCTERDGKFFKLVGVPVGLCHEQSKRRKQVTRLLNSRGTHTAKAAAVATLATRQVKEIPPSRQELLSAWQKVNRRHGFTTSSAKYLLGRSPSSQIVPDVSTTTSDAVNDLLGKQAHFSEQELIRATAIHAQGRGIPVSDILRAVQSLLADDRQIVRLGDLNGERRYTTPAMISLEKAMLESIEQRKEDGRFVIASDHVKVLLDLRLPLQATLSDDDFARNHEQRLAVEHLVLKPGLFQVVEGKAGTGKTFMLGVCREAWEAAGYRVLGIALSGVAARSLHEGSGISSDTLAMRLSQFTGKRRYRRHQGQLSRLAPGQSTDANWKAPILDSRTIVVLDEAAMVSTVDVADLVEHCRRRGAKLVMVGDRKQLQAIQAGGALAGVANTVGKVDLQHVVRQKKSPHDPRPYWAREAVHHFSEGRALEALKLYAERGLVTIADNRDAAIWHLVQDWSLHGMERPAENVILAATNAEVDRLNVLCQAARHVMHGRAPKSIRIGSEHVVEGDQVLFTRKSRLLGLENGDRGNVVGIDRQREVLTVQLNNDQRQVFVPLKEYQDLRLGYATTVHKAQSATFENVFVLAGGMMQDLHLSYVQASRAKDITRFYVDRLEAGEDLIGLATQMNRSHAKEFAHDVEHPPAGDALENAATNDSIAPSPVAAPLSSDATPVVAPSKKPSHDDDDRSLGKVPGTAAAGGRIVPPSVAASPPPPATPTAAPRTALDKPLLYIRDASKGNVQARSQQFLEQVRERREREKSTSKNTKKTPQELIAQWRQSRPKVPREASPTAGVLSTNDELAEKLRLADESFRKLREPTIEPAAENQTPKKPDKSKQRPKVTPKAVPTRIGKSRKASTKVREPAADALMVKSTVLPSFRKPPTERPPDEKNPPDAVANLRPDVKTTKTTPPIAESVAVKKDDIDLSHVAIAVTLDLAYLRAAIRRYGRLPGGIVVEEDATSSLPLRSLRIDPACPTRILVNDNYAFDTRLTADEVTCIWHAVGQSSSSYNFGAINQIEVAGIERDTTVAATLMGADNALGGHVYGYDTQYALTPTLVNGYLNPFTSAADVMRRWSLPDVRRIAANHLERVRPQVFLCFSNASFRVVTNGSLTVSTCLLTVAMGALDESDKVVNEIDAATKRFPLEYAAMTHIVSNFRRYARLLPALARCTAYAELVQLLRLGKTQQATMHDLSQVAKRYDQRPRHPVPRRFYTSRTQPFVDLCRTTAHSIEQRRTAGKVLPADTLHANFLGLFYARQAGDARLSAYFKRHLVATQSASGSSTPKDFKPHSCERWPHDAMVETCLSAARSRTSTAVEVASYLQGALEYCQPALKGEYADSATICCFVTAMSRRNPGFNPLPDLRSALSHGRMRNMEASLLPFSTLSDINYDRQTSDLFNGNATNLAANIRRMETELGVSSLTGVGLTGYRSLRNRPDKRAHVIFLETIRRRRGCLADFGAVVENSRPRNELDALAGIVIYRMRMEKPRLLVANYLHRSNPFFLSRPLLESLSRQEAGLMLQQLEEATMRDTTPAIKSWWHEVKQSYQISLNGSIIFAGELLARKKTMNSLWEEMQRYKVANPQEGLFWLDLTC